MQRRKSLANTNHAIAGVIILTAFCRAMAAEPATSPVLMPATGKTPAAPATQPAWRPKRANKDLRLQDFCIFRDKGYTYVASMMKDFCNEGIAVARSKDRFTWGYLGIAVNRRTPEDASMVWAPHVVESDGVFHMFYTGVISSAGNQWNQRILVASTRQPSAVTKWQRDEKVKFLVDGQTQSWFRPSHPGHIWPATGWADCRDPMVFYYRKTRTWHMFYSGTDTTGGIVGVATAPEALGPWQDRGAVLRVTRGIPESAFVLQDPDGGFVMTFNHAGANKDGGTRVARGTSLVPVNSEPSFDNVEILSQSTAPSLPGWAHEFINNDDGTVLAAYLTGYWTNFQNARFVKESKGWTIGPLEAETRPHTK